MLHKDPKLQQICKVPTWDTIDRELRIIAALANFRDFNVNRNLITNALTTYPTTFPDREFQFKALHLS